jgi:hypothetical protein
MSSFKVIKDLISTQESHPNPVVEARYEGEVLVVSCKDFSGEISSTTGIQGRFIYIPKLVNRLSGVDYLSPTVRIICGEECKTKCINL